LDFLFGNFVFSHVQTWIKAFYCDISSAVQIFFIWKRCSTRDPLLPYLFILALEILSAAITNDPEITDVKRSQYADDSSLILDDISEIA
jgi:hypothetical protein